MKELRIKRDLIQIGGSKGIIIPMDFIEGLKITDNDQLYLTLMNGKIVVERVV